MQNFFEFGEQVDGFPVRVVNERAVRAAAGLLFVPAFISFMNAVLLGNFQPTRLFVVVFMLDMAIRLFINPRWAPSLILGQWFVRRQQAEWVGAAQKRFAWGLGLLLGAGMFWLMVLNQVVGPINMLVCGTCLLLMFFESAFGICLGCKLYNIFNRDKAQLCPGGVCEAPAGAGSGSGLGLGAGQLVVLLAFAGVIGLTGRWVSQTAGPVRIYGEVNHPQVIRPDSAGTDPAEIARCRVPDFAKAIGHDATWKLHNNCN
jgi:hypothetical protein